jgi:hypothetical protein
MKKTATDLQPDITVLSPLVGKMTNGMKGVGRDAVVAAISIFRIVTVFTNDKVSGRHFIASTATTTCVVYPNNS